MNTERITHHLEEQPMNPAGFMETDPETSQIPELAQALTDNGIEMAANNYFSLVVRSQKDRGHTVVTGGPYRYVRHRGYVGGILFQLGTPLLLGTLWALIPAGLTALLPVVRTALEDRTFLSESAGYGEYAQRTRCQLLLGF